MADNVEKTALDKAERNKMIKSMLAASLAAAGIGALVKNIKAKKKRNEDMDVSSSKNAIVIPIEKSKFMEGIPTPEQHASEFGAKSIASSTVSEPEDIDARKKEILKGARKVDFFKRAKEEGSESDSNDDSKPKNDDKDDDGRTFLRDQSGRFASPTDPLAIKSVEKEADYDWGKGVWDTFAHPIETAKKIYEASKDKPVAFAAGGVASIILAAKISDVINKFRRQKARERLENARGEYVKLLESNDGEKAAEANDDPRSGAGALIGASLFVPMAITALVTNRIIENRRREKKREKEMSDSYPDEPIILYKTSEDKSIRITPETALFAMMMKQAMIESAERDEMAVVMYKSAFWGEEKARNVISNGLENARNSIEDKIISILPAANMEQAEDIVMSTLEDPRNNDILFELAQNPDAGITPEMVSKIKERTSLGGQINLGTVRNAMKDPTFMPKLMSKVKTSDRMQKLIVNRATSDDYADTWGKYKNDKINEHLGKYFKSGSMLHRIFSWFLRNTGLGNYFAKNHINDYFNSMRSAQQNANQPNQQQSAQQMQGIPSSSQQGVAPATAQVGPTVENAQEDNLQKGWEATVTKNLEDAERAKGQGATPPIVNQPNPNIGTPNAAKVKNGQKTVAPKAPPMMRPNPNSAPAAKRNAAKSGTVFDPFSKLLPWQNWQ